MHSGKIDLEESVLEIKIRKKNQNSIMNKKCRIENNTFWKNLSERDYCVPRKGIRM